MSITAFEVAVALVRRADGWLVAQRRVASDLRMRWKSLGGNRVLNETTADAALRELRDAA